MMLTHTFQLFLITCCIVTVAGVTAFAIFCRYRAKSFIGTGRVADIQAWDSRADISWVIAVLSAIVSAVAMYAV